ncbi:MAG: hypothetical protein ACE5HW_00155 [Candidatus Methanofastidiosia archaeon]
MNELIERYLLKLEEQLMIKKGKWLADFNESFRDFEVNGNDFLMYLEGETRTKGFLLSKIAAFLLTPNYKVGVFVYLLKNERDFQRIVLSLEKLKKKEDMEWLWLIFLKENKFSKNLIERVERDNSKRVGIGLLNLQELERVRKAKVIHNSSFIGRQIPRYFQVKL